ncbi:hypothetical protein MMC10_000810 [Thelotrema lepadinum]|nr:hypothetical protein [Thelotrema lepadinum]
MTLQQEIFDIEIYFVTYDAFFEPTECMICSSVQHVSEDEPENRTRVENIKTLPSPNMILTSEERDETEPDDFYEPENHDPHDAQDHDLCELHEHSLAKHDVNKPIDHEATEAGLIIGGHLKELKEEDRQQSRQEDLIQLEEDILEQTIEGRVVQESINTIRRLFGECRTLDHHRASVLYCFWHRTICSYTYGYSRACRGLLAGQRCQCDFTPEISKGRPVRPRLPAGKQNPRKDLGQRRRQKLQAGPTKKGGQARRKIPESPRGSRAPDPKSRQRSWASNRVTRSKSKQTSSETPQGPRAKYGEFPPELRALLLDYVGGVKRPVTPGGKSTTTGYSKKS